MTSTPNKLLLAFYGDDFTGSTDALEFLSRAGAKTILFIEPPTAEKLGRYHGLDAIGVAGITRSMTPEKMEEQLVPAFKILKQSGARHIHYKVCSTFDSSPSRGSIGRAIDIGHEIFCGIFIPVLVAAPALGRYSVFGNLFARMGIGSQGRIYRLDRHPSMSKHPSTPSDESDLRLHLAKQTQKKSGLVDITQVNDELKIRNTLNEEIKNDNQIIFFDAVYEEQLMQIGKVIDSFAGKDPLFSVGSSGIEMALGNFWKETGILKSQPTWNPLNKVGSLLVISGSCSPVTSGQIAWALNNNFREIIITTATANDNSILDENIAAAVKIIKDGISVIIHTGGNNAQQFNSGDSAEIFGTALGNIAKAVAQQTGIKKIVVAGGDTSGYAARAMGIEAVEMIAPLSPGAPLCKVYAPGSPVDGLEINFKGGQVGEEDYFGKAKGI